VTFGQRILLAVPHPDDEVVACAAALQRASSAGAKVFALYLTHGCIAQDVMWLWQRKNYAAIVARRRAEAEHVAHALNIEPVGWSQRPARFLWQQMSAVRDEIQTAIKTHDIDQLWVPAYEGGNPDHDAINAIGQVFKPNLSVLEFAEYNFADGKPNSNQFPQANGTEQIVELNAEERRAKQYALALYISEKSNLSYVKTERECFRPLANYDYSRAPHPGKLWYNRFQWVPFRHPRVDFTRPADVTNSILQFLEHFIVSPPP